MFDQQTDNSDKSIQSVEAFCSDQGGVVVLLSKCSVAQVHAHLGGHAEEPGDQVVGLQQAMEVHLLDEDEEGLGGVLTS